MADQTLASYRLECRRLLHDATGKFWTNAELNDYINDGRQRTAAFTGCIRKLLTVSISQGLEQYPVGGVTGGNVTAGGSGYTNPTVSIAGDGSGAAATAVVASGAVTSIYVTDPGTGYSTATLSIVGGGGVGATLAAPTSIAPNCIPTAVLDIMNITPLWGNQRIPLRYMPWTEFNARMRSWVVNPQTPVCWSRYGMSTSGIGGSTAFFGPIPDQTYQTELDTTYITTDLVNDADIDTQLLYPYSSPVAFYACWKAKFTQQAFGDADTFLSVFKMKILEAQAAIQMRRIPNPYNGYSGAA